VKEWPETPDDGAFALCILWSFQCRVRGGQHWTHHHLCIAPDFLGKATVASIDSLGIPAKEVVRHAEFCGCEAIGSVKSKRPLQPWQCLRGSTCPHQDGASIGIVVSIARIEFKRPVDLRQCEIIALSENIDLAEHVIGASCCRIQHQCLFCECFRTLEIVRAEFGPP